MHFVSHCFVCVLCMMTGCLPQTVQCKCSLQSRTAAKPKTRCTLTFRVKDIQLPSTPCSGLPRISKITVTRNSIARSVIMKLAHFGAKASSTWRYMTWRYDVYLSARINPTVISSEMEKKCEGSSAVYLSAVIMWSEKWRSNSGKTDKAPALKRVCTPVYGWGQRNSKVERSDWLWWVWRTSGDYSYWEMKGC